MSGFRSKSWTAGPKSGPATHPAWRRVQLARHPKRPHSLDYIERIFTDFQEIHGDRGFGDDPAIVAGSAQFDGRPVMVVAEQKGRDTKQQFFRNFGMPKPEGYRKALRVMQMAAKFGRPIITLSGYAGRLSRDRRRGARAGGGDRAQSAGDGAAAGAGDRGVHRGRRFAAGLWRWASAIPC